jgi:hypothetical protein
VNALPGAQTVLDLFAHGSLSFLLALVAVSLVTALIGAAAEEYIRPRAQARIFEDWAQAVIKRFNQILDGGSPRHPYVEFVRESLDRHGLFLPAPLLAAGPDQVSAQAAKRLDRVIALLASVREPRPKERPLGAAGFDAIEALRQRLEREADDQVDLLQSRLIQRATQRAYGAALVTSVAIGAFLYGLARRVDPQLDLFTWFVVTGVLGLAATLLAPMLQTQIGRLLRAS